MKEVNYFTREEVAEMLGVTIATIKIWMLEKKIPMYDNKAEIQKNPKSGFKWYKGKFLRWKAEVWDKRGDK